MWRAAALAALALVAAPAGADQATVRVGVAFAAGVQAGDHSGLTIGIEVDERGPLVIISQLVPRVDRLPGYPLPPAPSCGDPDALVVDSAFTLPAEVAAMARSATSALDVLVGAVSYVSRRAVLDSADQGPQDGVSVLRRGRGRCSGRANLAVGMLRALGIPARVVHGLVFEGRQARWHRWGEAWFGPLGWLPFDPGTGAGIISVRYLPCRGVVSGLQPPAVALERIDESDFMAMPTRGGLKVPLVRGVSLTCQAPLGAQDLTAILVDAAGTRWFRRGRDEVVFSGLLPGRYWLTWQAAALIVPRVPLDLSRMGDVTIALSAKVRATPAGGGSRNGTRATGRSDS